MVVERVLIWPFLGILTFLPMSLQLDPLPIGFLTLFSPLPFLLYRRPLLIHVVPLGPALITKRWRRLVEMTLRGEGVCFSTDFV